MKNKKTLWMLLPLIAALVWWLNQADDRGMGELSEESYAFGIEDTASVDRIVISNKVPQRVKLYRNKQGVWQLNGRPIRKDAMEVLMETLKRMTMRNFVPENSREEIIRRMATYGKEVEVFQGDECVAHFYVGTDTQDQLGTYMLKKGAALPFAVHIPGFNGYLSSRFITVEELWYDRQLIEASPAQWARIEVQSEDPAWPSFSLQQNAGKWKPTGSEAGTNGTKAYIAQLAQAKYEGAIVESDGIYSRKDSLLALTPYWQLKWTLEDSTSHELKAYRIKPAEDAADAQGNPLRYDPDRMHGILDDGRMVLLQFYGMRHVMGGPDALSISIE